MATYIECPHCDGLVEIMVVNCGIFRHGTFRDGQQLPPHASEPEIRKWLADDLVLGCGKPFRSDGITVEKCGYE